MKKNKNKKKESIISILITGLLIFALVVCAYGLATSEPISAQYQVVPRDLGGSVHDDKSIYVRIDMSQPGSLAVYKNLQQNCLKLNIRSCMSAEDLLNLKK